MIDFEEYKKKAATNKALQGATQAIGTAALIDITQEINTVIRFMRDMKEETGAELFTAEDPERCADLIILARLCELHGNNLLNIAGYAKKKIAKATAADREKAQEIEQEIEQQPHNSILQKWVNAFLN